MKQKRISMPVRYGINLVLTIALWAVLFGLIRSGSITNYWSGILVTVGINIILAVSLNMAGAESRLRIPCWVQALNRSAACG